MSVFNDQEYQNGRDDDDEEYKSLQLMHETNAGGAEEAKSYFL